VTPVAVVLLRAHNTFRNNNTLKKKRAVSFFISLEAINLSQKPMDRFSSYTIDQQIDHISS
jgi:hypothetical protein